MYLYPKLILQKNTCISPDAADIDWGATDTIDFGDQIDFDLGDITLESGGVLATEGEVREKLYEELKRNQARPLSFSHSIHFYVTCCIAFMWKNSLVKYSRHKSRFIYEYNT